MNRIIFLLLLCLQQNILVAQDTSRHNLSKTADIKQIKLDIAKEFPKYDTIIAVVKYQDKDSLIKTDTCSLAIRAYKAYVFENYGQYYKDSLPFGVTLQDRYAIITDWKIFKATRLRNNKNLYKGRIFDIKYLYEKNKKDILVKNDN